MNYTEGSRRLFLETGTRFPRDIIWAMGAIKLAAARANNRLGLLDGGMASAIEAAAREVMDGSRDPEIVVDVFQTGSGTGLNMNVNEVIARRASEILGSSVHPNDHVNMSQSSNDVVPTAIRAAAAKAAAARMLPALGVLAAALEELSSRTASVYKSGRTHLRDALPITMGQEFGAYAHEFSRDAAALESAISRVRELPLGGTAVGTGLNSPEGFADAAIEELSSISGIEFRASPNRFASMRLLTDLVDVSASLRSTALDLFRLSQDLRLMFSGPVTGLNEIDIPSQAEIAGSSIMPGKTNPVTVEACLQASAQVMGLDHAIQIAGMLGEFELSMGVPLAGYDIAMEMSVLSEALSKMASVVVGSVAPNEERTRRYAESSPSLITVISPVIGYERAAEVGKRLVKGLSIREALKELGFDDSAIDGLLDLRRLVRPGIPARDDR
ncbi:MAG: class II fumarate hydratase [Nitrososphaeria archaeon]